MEKYKSMDLTPLEKDRKGGTSTLLAFNRDRTQMGIDNALDNRKAKPCPNNLTGLRRFDPIEFIKDPCQIFLLNTNPRIRNRGFTNPPSSPN
jgi:hypothetical protein